MYRFGKSSEKRLDTCCDDFQVLFNEVIKYIDCSVICGYRNKEEQDSAFSSKKSKLKYPMSKHNVFPSNAVDVAPYPIQWKNGKRFYYFGGFVLGIARMLYNEGKMKHRIKWGGDWDMDNDLNDQSFNDLVHLETIL